MANDSGSDFVKKYVADMAGVVGHVYQAIDKQVKETEGEEVNGTLARFRDSLEAQHNALNTRLEELGGNPAGPIKQAGASLLGIAAGLIDKIRAEEISKDFRDDYTAFAMTHIAYLMLNTTALATGDQQTADIAQNGLKETAQFISDIGGLMPQLVVNDLSDAANVSEQAVEQARGNYKDAWAAV